jgi:hypothetical protein
MQLIEVKAQAGYLWFRQGIWLFRRNPLAFLMLFFSYVLAMLLVSEVPVLGDLLPLLVIPGVAVGFMAACRDAIVGKPVFPLALLSGFRLYGAVVARRLALLGVLYAVAIVLAFAVSTLVDGGTLFKMMVLGTPVTPEMLTGGSESLAMMVFLAAYIPVAMLFWFAPILTAWHDIAPHKALFFSWVACWRNRGAFALYGLIWAGLAIASSFILVLVFQAFQMDNAALALMMPVTITLSTMLYCSFYATYRGCFAVPSGAEETIPLDADSQDRP